MPNEDISRDGFDPRKGYSGVRMQQGRVLVDDDWNENERIDDRDRRETRNHIIGRAGSPDQGFRIMDPRVEDGELEFTIEPGTFYLGGHRLQRDVEGSFRVQKDWLTRPEEAAVRPEAGRFDLVYLSLWEQPVSAVEDGELLEVALGGPDTSTRKRLMHRVHVEPDVGTPDCGEAWDQLVSGWAGENLGTLDEKNRRVVNTRLRASFSTEGAAEDLCSPSVAGGYLGAENQAIRVQLVDTDHLTWGFDNASPLYRIEVDASGETITMVTEPPDAEHWPRTGQVVEILAHGALLPNGETVAEHAGHLTAVEEAYDPDTDQFTIQDSLPSDFGTGGSSNGTGPELPSYLYLRVWDRGSDRSSEPALPIGTDPIVLGQTGVEVQVTGSDRVAGDFWILAVRPETPHVIVPWEFTNGGRSPNGVSGYYAPLALIQWEENEGETEPRVIRDCRDTFRPLIEQHTCCDFTVGDGIHSRGDFRSLGEAVQNLPASGGEICILPGLHETGLTWEGLENVTIRGCGRDSRLIPARDRLEDPLLELVDCRSITLEGLDLLSYSGPAMVATGHEWGDLDKLTVENCRFLALTTVIQIRRGRRIRIRENNIRLLDRSEGRAALELQVEHSTVERNRIAVVPAESTPPTQPPAENGEELPDPTDQCVEAGDIYARPRFAIWYAEFLWAYVFQLLPQQPYRAYGGIHLLGSSEDVHILNNQIQGGAGNGITLGGLLDLPAPSPDESTDEPPTVTVSSGTFYSRLVNQDGDALSGVTVTLAGDNGTFHVLSDSNGIATRSVPEGSYEVEVSSGYRIVDTQSVVVGSGRIYTFVLETVDVSTNEREGFIYDLEIEKNTILHMGRSGIGFALYGPLAPRRTTVSDLPSQFNSFLAAFAPRQVTAANLIEDMTIRENHIHECLRNPFTDAMREETTETGLGGISLGLCEDVLITGNRVHDNGLRSVDPVCGIFVAYGENLECSENDIFNNGPRTENEPEELTPGIRGGVVIRLASSLFRAGESRTNHRLACRIQNNRIDQPAGRAITLFAFGPVSCVGNHLNSERTGRWSYLDDLVGNVLILNLGGLQNLLGLSQIFRTGDLTHGNANVMNLTDANRTSDSRLMTNLAAPAFHFPGHGAGHPGQLPGGETLFNSNQTRLGVDNRSLISHCLLTAADLGYDGNQSALFNRERALLNALAIGFTLRASDNRFEEFTSPAELSLLSTSLVMNNTTNNQGHHCIIANNGLESTYPTVETGNQVLDTTGCDQIASSPVQYLLRRIIQILFSDQFEPGLTISRETIQENARLSVSESIGTVRDVQLQRHTQQQKEFLRLNQKWGPDHDRTRRFETRLQQHENVLNHLAVEEELVEIDPPGVAEKGSVIEGRVSDRNLRGAGDLEVELVNEAGESLGYTTRTSRAGYYAFELEESDVEQLQDTEVFVRIRDPRGEEVVRTDESIRVEPDQRIRRMISTNRVRDVWFPGS